MAKVRSKLKRHTKGKSWSKGHSSTSNPEQMKYRMRAKPRFFQPNLKLAPDNASNPNALTLDALLRHDQRQAFETEATTVNEVAGNLETCNLDDDDDSMFESKQDTFKTFNTFASNYSSCSNMSFKKLLSGFRASSTLHKEMLAILTALTEIIKERGGTESSTEYFLLLMEQIEASREESDIVAGVSLLAMGIKSVPTAVLRKRFGETAQTLLSLLQRFVESSNQSVMKYIIGCLSVLLRVQDYSVWTYSSNWQYIDAILSFTIHTKPKIRKAAQHAIVSIIHGSSFMEYSRKTNEDDQQEPDITVGPNPQKIKWHPASSRITKFCLNQLQQEILVNSQTTVLHTITLLKDTFSVFKSEDIRTICEQLLSIMTAANVLIRANCFQALHSLFSSCTTNLSGSLCAKLLVAIHEYRPDISDVRQTLAWLTVLKAGHIHLATLDIQLCVNALPRFIGVCTSDLWLSDRTEIIASVSNCLKELLYECIRPVCSTQELADIYRQPVKRSIHLIEKVLNAPFGNSAKFVILTFSIVYEVCGQYFSDELVTSLLTLNKRYDTQSSLRIQIEHSIIEAIKSMGPERVLQSIPLTNAKGEILIEKSWLLPLLREGVTGATFKFFKEAILPLALDCNSKWHSCAQSEQNSMSHTYELLCCQLWSLFPGFCRQPNDPDNFRLIAPTLGNALDNNPEFRMPIFDGLIELLQSDHSAQIHIVLANYSNNFLTRLFNIYTQKPNGTYEADVRKKSFEVIKLYLTKVSEAVLKDLFESAKSQLIATEIGTFEYDAIFDITAALVLFQTSEVIRQHFETFIVPVLKNQKSELVSGVEQKLRKQQRKTYELLRDILTCEAASCHKFSRKYNVALQQLLLDAYGTSCAVCQAARLKCLKILIQSRKSISATDKIIMKTIPEAVVSYKEFSTHKENISEDIIIFIANLYQEANKLNDLVDILTAGFVGEESLIANTILAFRTMLQHQGKHMTIETLEFILEQVSVFLVQKSRSQSEAAVAFLITFIKVLPTPLVANHLETIMKSLSAMVKDTKRYCRIQIGYLLKKLCKRFSAEELVKFVPGDDEVTHRRLKKIRKQLRRETRKKLNEDNNKDSDDGGESEEEFIAKMEKKSVTIEDILADSDSDFPDEMNEDNANKNGIQTRDKLKSKSKSHSAYIHEDPEEIVDLADIKSIGHILTNHPGTTINSSSDRPKMNDVNRGFKTAEDGRLIISDEVIRGIGCNDGDITDSSDDDLMTGNKKAIKRGMEDDSSDVDQHSTVNLKCKSTGALSMRSGRTGTTRYTTGGKGIHRTLGVSDVVSMKSGHSTKVDKWTNSTHIGMDYGTKKAKGDMKKKGKLDPYAYISLNKSKLNKRKSSKLSGTFTNIVKGARKGALKGVKTRISKHYKE